MSLPTDPTPQDVPANAPPPAKTKDEIDALSELTRIASERVTWLQAEEITHRRAAEAFRTRQDKIASLLRTLADEFGEKAATASEAQDKQMRKCGLK